jgi:hypothetical protein
MTLRYLSEHRESALFSIDLARKEATQLQYSHRTLYAQPIDIEWVERLAEDQAMAEKVEAFVSRFGRLQDHIGEKLLPRFALLLGESPKSMLDTMAYAERMGWIGSAEDFFSARKLRNLLIHEYMSDAVLFLQALMEAKDAAEMLLSIVDAIGAQARTVGLR